MNETLQAGQFSIFPCELAAGLDPYSQTALAWLWKYRNSDSGKCFPSLNKLCAVTGQGKDRLLKSLDNLASIGAIRVIRRAGKDGSKIANEYDCLLSPEAGGGRRGRPTPSRGVGTPLVAGADMNYTKENYTKEKTPVAAVPPTTGASAPGEFSSFDEGCPTPPTGGKAGADVRELVARMVADSERIVGSALPFGAVVRLVKGLLKRYAVEEIEAGWGTYLDKLEDAMWFSIPGFCRRAGLFIAPENHVGPVGVKATPSASGSPEDFFKTL